MSTPKSGGRVHGLPVWGYDFPPGRVAIQTLQQPWAPAWMAGLIDDKPAFEETAAETTRGNFKPPLWRRSYLGRWHGLASADIRGGTVDVLAQWVRAPKKATRMEDIGTLTMRYAANEPDLADTYEGHAGEAGLPLTFQSRNRAIVFAKPLRQPRALPARVRQGRAAMVSQLATVIGLWNFADKPDWEIFVGGQKVTSFPHRSTGQRAHPDPRRRQLPRHPADRADRSRPRCGDRDRPGRQGQGAADQRRDRRRRSPSRCSTCASRRRCRSARSTSRRSPAGPTAPSCWSWAMPSSTAASRPSCATSRATRSTPTWHADQNVLEVAYKSGKDLMEASFSQRLRPADRDAFRDRSRPAGEGLPGAAS